MNRRKLTSALAFLLIFGLVQAGSAQKLRKQGRYYVGEIEKTFDVSPGGSLTMENIQGDVTVSSWDKPEVWVHEIRRMDVYTEEEARAAMEAAETSYEQQGNDVIVRGERSRRRHVQSDFEVKVPRRFNVKVSTAGGDVQASDIEGKVRMKTSGGDVRVDTVDGDLWVHTSGGDISLRSVEGTVEAATSGGDIEAVDVGADALLKTSGGDIVLENVKGGIEASTSGGDITVRGSSSDVSVRTSGGDIQVKDVQAGVTASTSGGDIVISRAPGRIEASTAGGDVRLLQVGESEARTAGGDIKAETVTTGIKARTAGGDLNLSDVQGYVEGQTSGGNIEVEVTLEDYSLDHHADLSTAGGDVVLYLPEDIPASLQAVIEVERDDWEEYSILSDFDIKITLPRRGERRRRVEIRGEGELNGGGDPIRLRTVNGNIEIRKLRR